MAVGNEQAMLGVCDKLMEIARTYDAKDIPIMFCDIGRGAYGSMYYRVHIPAPSTQLDIEVPTLTPTEATITYEGGEE